MRLIWIGALGMMVACVPYPRQLGLLTPPPRVAVIVPVSRIGESSQPLFRVADERGRVLPSVFCFGPTRFEPIQGASGSLVWLRSAWGGSEIEALLHATLDPEEKQALENAISDSGQRPSLLIPCPLQIVRLSPLANLPVPITNSFAHGRDSQAADVLLIRLSMPLGDRDKVLRMMASTVGLAYEVTYMIQGTSDEQNALVLLRSGNPTRPQ